MKKDLSNNPIEDHRIIFEGDKIDRSPDSAGGVEYLINLMADITVTMPIQYLQFVSLSVSKNKQMSTERIQL